MAERSAVAGRISLRLLGRWHLNAHGVDITLGQREQRLAAVLGLRGPRSWVQVARDLWPESTDETALSSLGWDVLRTERQCPGLLRVDRATVALDPDVDVDVADLRRTAGLTGPPAPSEGDALDWLLGVQELLVGWHDDWVLQERERIQRLRIRALERLAQRAREGGDVAGAILASTAASDIESSLEESDRPHGATWKGHERPAAPPDDAADHGRPHRAAARAGLVGALLVLSLVVALVLALSGPSGPPPPAGTTRPTPTSPTGLEVQMVPAQVLQVEPRQLTVRASGAVGSVTLMITATRRPAPVRLALWSPAGAQLEAAKQVVVRNGSERFTWTGLAAGVYRWQATSPTARFARGRVEVSPEPAPVAPAVEAPSTPTATPTSAPAPTPTATAPPAPAPSPTASPTPTPDPGPTGPVDPHTHAPPPVG